MANKTLWNTLRSALPEETDSSTADLSASRASFWTFAVPKREQQPSSIFNLQLNAVHFVIATCLRGATFTMKATTTAEYCLQFRPTKEYSTVSGSERLLCSDSISDYNAICTWNRWKWKIKEREKEKQNKWHTKGRSIQRYRRARTWWKELWEEQTWTISESPTDWWVIFLR